MLLFTAIVKQLLCGNTQPLHVLIKYFIIISMKTHTQIGAIRNREIYCTHKKSLKK